MSRDATVPHIATQPFAQVVIAGGTATFSVAATNPGSGSLTYHWYLTSADSAKSVNKERGPSRTVRHVRTSDNSFSPVCPGFYHPAPMILPLIGSARSGKMMGAKR